MSPNDWLAVYFILPCLLFKSTRVAALVLLIVFPFYALTIHYTHQGMFRYMFFGVQDTLVSIIFLKFASINKTYKMEGIIALLAASAVAYHFFAFVAYEKGFGRAFYGNACTIIVILQITMLYTRIVTDARIFKDTFRGILFRFADVSNYYHGNKLAQRAQNKKV